MMVNRHPDLPDYPLADRRVVVAPEELKAMAHPLRSVILDLVMERAATITELAFALKRPKSTVAHHVAVLVDADMLKVVRTRRVRAIEERFYGRTARLFYVGELDPSDIDPPPWAHPLRDAMRESEDAYRADTMWANTRHVRIGRDQARAFWARLEDVVAEFSAIPRDGDQVFGLTVALYPTDFPTLPDATA
jgi:DNA-binding transcriptional ArsR family regulator